LSRGAPTSRAYDSVISEEKAFMLMCFDLYSKQNTQSLRGTKFTKFYRKITK